MCWEPGYGVTYEGGPEMLVSVLGWAVPALTVSYLGTEPSLFRPGARRLMLQFHGYLVVARAKGVIVGVYGMAYHQIARPR